VYLYYATAQLHFNNVSWQLSGWMGQFL
jgi:hypothetical protein